MAVIWYFNQVICGCDCTILRFFLQGSPDWILPHVKGRWKLILSLCVWVLAGRCVSFICCKEIGQCDLLEVPSSSPVPVLLIHLPAPASPHGHQSQTLSWKNLRGVLVGTRTASPSQHAQSVRQKKERCLRLLQSQLALSSICLEKSELFCV